MRIRKFLQQRGLGPESDPEESDPLSPDQPWLAYVYAASVRGRVVYGINSGRRTHGDQIDPERMKSFSSPRCATVDGFSLHANVAIAAGDRARLERLAQYCVRGPVALERLEALTDGRLLYRFKRAWRDGTTHIILTPLASAVGNKFVDRASRVFQELDIIPPSRNTKRVSDWGTSARLGACAPS
jgi:putative transposase